MCDFLQNLNKNIQSYIRIKQNFVHTGNGEVFDMGYYYIHLSTNSVIYIKYSGFEQMHCQNNTWNAETRVSIAILKFSQGYFNI